MKKTIIKFSIYTILTIIVFVIGSVSGYLQCRNKYKSDYEFQHLQIDTLNKKALNLKTTYDSIKKSPCYKKNKEYGNAKGN